MNIFTQMMICWYMALDLFSHSEVGKMGGNEINLEKHLTNSEKGV